MENSNQQSSLKPDTLDFILDYTKDAPEHQLQDADMLDNKVIQILSIASIIIGLLGFGVGKHSLSHTVTIIPVIIAVVAYVAVVYFSIVHLRTAAFRRSLHADDLWQEYWDDTVMDIKHTLVSDISESYSYNKVIIHKKGDTLFRALTSMGVQVASVGVFIILFLLGA